MAKCSQCGNEIDAGAANYRPSKGNSRRAASIRVCHRCVDRYDDTQSNLKMRNMVILGVIVLITIGFGLYLAIKK